MIDTDGNETDYVLDNLGEVSETKTRQGRPRRPTTLRGRVSSETDADGRVIQYSYNNDDEEIGEVWKNSSGATVNVETFTYDNDGNELTAADTTAR